MRFRFCGDSDCPDWVLAQIAALSKLTSIKMKLLCTEVVSDLTKNSINFEKIESLTSDAKFDTEDAKSCVSALAFILSSCSKYNIDAETLSNELQQLGLPKEHTAAMCKVYSENYDEIHDGLKMQSLRLNKLKSIDCKIVTQFSSSRFKINAPVLHVNLKSESMNKTEAHDFYIKPDKLAVLIYELKGAQQLMNEVNQ